MIINPFSFSNGSLLMDSFLRTIDDELNDGDDESIFVLQFFRNLIFEKFYARGMCEYS